MRALIQRVTQASVAMEGRIVGEIAAGLLVLVGVETDDTAADADWLAAKIAGLRVLADGAGKMNRSVQDLDGQGTQGGLLIVSQFTLAADVRSGNRPSFTAAAAPDEGLRLYDAFVVAARHHHGVVQTGVFAADMQVSLVNDGPVTIPLRMPPQL